MQELPPAPTGEHACFANLNQSISHAFVGGIIVLNARPQNTGPMRWIVSAREGLGAGTANGPSRELIKFVASAAEVFVEVALANTN